MNPKSAGFFEIPQGTEAFHLEEAFFHKKTVARFENLLDSWGYLPVQTPVLDYFDVYRNLLDEPSTEKIYRLIDRDGALLMLRSDITLFLAKQMSLALKKDILPVRVSYSDSILRYQDRENPSSNEFFQAGAELIGIGGPDGDLEIIYLLHKTMKTLNVPGFKIHLGSRALFDSILKEVPNNLKTALAKTLISRKTETALSLLDKADWNEIKSKVFCEIFMTLTEASDVHKTTVEKNLEKHFPDTLTEYKNLASILTSLDRLGIITDFRLDLCEIGSQPYYSGLIFSVYAPGADTCIAGGGRYDGLLNRFGCPTETTTFSVGFSVLLRKIESQILWPVHDRIASQCEFITGHDIVECIKKADELTTGGQRIILKEKSC